MGDFFENYGRTIIYCIVGTFLMSIIFGFVLNKWEQEGKIQQTNQVSSNEEIKKNSPIPNLSGIKNYDGSSKTVKIKAGENFNPMHGVTATDTKDGDITDQIVFSLEKVDKAGDTKIEKVDGHKVIVIDPAYKYYNVIYKITNSRGYKNEQRVKILVI